MNNHDTFSELQRINNSNYCSNCGGFLLGDGLTTVRHCERLDITGLCVEPDAAPIPCIKCLCKYLGYKCVACNDIEEFK